jgi:hypothetical protein
VRDYRPCEAVPFSWLPEIPIGRFSTVLVFARRDTSRRYWRYWHVRRFACRRVPVWPHALLLGAPRSRGAALIVDFVLRLFSDAGMSTRTEFTRRIEIDPGHAPSFDRGRTAQDRREDRRASS